MKPPYTLFNASLNIIILKTVKTVVTRFASLNMIWITVLSIIFFELGSFGSIPECEFPGDLLLIIQLPGADLFLLRGNTNSNISCYFNPVFIAYESSSIHTANLCGI